jgi:hypothetical protein
MKYFLVILFLCSCSATRHASHKKVNQLVDMTAKRDTILSDKGLLIYEYADSLYVVRLDNNNVVNRYVVNKGYTWKQLFTVAIAALIVGIFAHFFLDKL